MIIAIVYDVFWFLRKIHRLNSEQQEICFQKSEAPIKMNTVEKLLFEFWGIASMQDSLNKPGGPLAV